MKNNLVSNHKFVFIFIVIMSIFNGCNKNKDIETKKDSNIITTKATTGSLSARESTLTCDNIRTWLIKEEDSANEYKNNVVRAILNNMQLDYKYVEPFQNNENLVIVPLKATYFSIHIKEYNQMPLQFLVMVEDFEGKIRRGDIVLFYPKESQTIGLPKNSFHDFFTNESMNIDGTFTLVTLDDVKQYEMDFDKGLKKQFRLWQGKLAPPINNTPTPPTCYQWTLEITDYDGDGNVIDVTDYDLGVTCTGGGGLGGSNGGNENSDPNPVPSQENDIMDAHAEVTLHVADKHTDHENWSVDADYILEGLVNHAHPSDNIFTGIANGYTPNPGIFYLGTFGDPSNSYYCTWTPTQNSGSMTNGGKTCVVHTAGVISYTAGSTQFYQKSGTWQASTTLH